MAETDQMTTETDGTGGATPRGGEDAAVPPPVQDGESVLGRIVSDDVVRDFLRTIKGFVSDTGSPEVVAMARNLLMDEAAVVLLRARSPGELTERAAAAVAARREAFFRRPGYAAALQQESLVSIGTRVLDGLASFGGSLLNGYIGAGVGKLDGLLERLITKA